MRVEWRRHSRSTSLTGWPIVIAAIVSLSACGGGGGSSGGTSNPAPTLEFTSDVLQVAPGNYANLTWDSSATSCTASGGWSGSLIGNGSQLAGPINVTTTFNLLCSNANSPATSGSVTVTVPVVPEPPPPATSSRVVSELAHTVLDYQRVAIGIRDIVWSPQHSLLYVVTRPDSTIAPNSLVSIDPVTLEMQVRQLGSEAWCVAVSHDGTYLFVGHRNGGTVQRFLADGLVEDISISVGNSSSWVLLVVPSPVAAQTIAVAVDKLDSTSSDRRGVVIADDDVIRPDKFHGSHRFSPTTLVTIDVNDIDWTLDGTRIYVVLRRSGVVELAVNTQGVNPVDYRFWPLFGEKVTLIGNELLSAGGRIFDLSGPIGLRGQFADASSSTDHVYSEARGKVFSLSFHRGLSGIYGTTVQSLDPDLHTFIDRVAFDGAAFVEYPSMLLWGADGIALHTPNELIIAHGTFAAAGGVPAPPADRLTVTKNEVFPFGALSVKKLDIGALDVATNPCGELYVSTAGSATVRPNSVLQLDPSNAAILRTGLSGGDAHFLATSDDCSMLYAGRQYSNSIARIRLEDLAIIDEIPTGSSRDGPMKAGSISVMPGQAQTVAVARVSINGTLCSNLAANMQVFDGVVPRPVSFGDESPPGFYTLGGVRSLVWGPISNVLYAQDWESLYALNVDASGPNSPEAVMPYRHPSLEKDLGRDLYFDSARNRIYNSFAYYYDIDAGVEVGPLPLTISPTGQPGCFARGQVITTDPDTGKVFWVYSTQEERYSISTYSPDSFANLADLRFSPPSDESLPMRVVRPTSNTLAVVTNGGYLILLQGSILEP